MRTWLAIATSLLLHSTMSANATALGDECCGDIKQRVAELETSVARENGVVTLHINGNLPVHLIVGWDYDWEDVVFLTEPSPILCFGNAGGLTQTTKYQLELEVQSSFLGTATEGTNSDNPIYNLSIRESVYFESERLDPPFVLGNRLPSE